MWVRAGRLRTVHAEGPLDLAARMVVGFTLVWFVIVCLIQIFR